ncbi:hypothetical protein [Nocardioides antri]|uniref:HNH endonuclease n=1 Tax=Nocardioides antri TaxID=2607659 RepID=A0A5B1M0B4_9ACTN|nr:hypothetical protein [Nocardioides antri]KAA1426605.1 hypothetical protein F0U47_14565 [Nocardioides antri]
MRAYDSYVAKQGGRMAERVREPIPDCWFCATPKAKTSREHIFPRWLTGELGVRDEEVTPMHVRLEAPNADHVMTKRPLAGFVATRICQECNNGWMSELETTARPVLTESPRKGRLTRAEAEILARWFAKTAVVLNVSQNFRLLVEARDRHELAIGIPNNATVALMRLSPAAGKTVDWIQTSPMTALVPAAMEQAAVQRIIERTLQVNIQVGDLGAVVTFAARPNTTEAVEGYLPAATPIWPLPARLPAWGSLPRYDSARDVAVTMRIVQNPFVR